ncbi:MULTISPECIES: class III extradiol dioxygenase subunit beta [Streptomyces]|uniref:Protocatechuate 4,5-dioxygenase beta chain n=2 Tax=Streptomyces TaxID=1883 RepID=A0A2J7Z2V7_STRMQ|nr:MULTISPECIES: class III extradiol dioxygenase subunit beta [Streptomyces]AQA09634.1 protocatechuate 3,4-dioxygenase [Streptomyces autolyticus]MCD9586397.1 protocatechuate 3,4-dioxygenase [Streptomyces sp. 8ZJF_21]PNG94604.1 Protocatechuate 4,5-dioxygenase beta chain [Streptomyces malaysiensis]
MSEVIWGLATSHVPSIGAAMDRGMTADPVWAPLFEGYRPARDWLAQNRPDVAILVYNDHANGVDFDIVPTFAIGTAEKYQVADEGFGRRPVPHIEGDPDFSFHILHHLMDENFDLTVFSELDVDHGFTVPLSVWTPEPGDAWPCPVIPIMVNVIRYPQPTAARCYALGQALGRAIAGYDGVRTVGILGTGGMSHQLAGARAGFINPTFDHMFLEAIEKDPQKLAELSREEYIREAGSEGIELIMWLVMRGAMNAQVRKVHSVYHVPASNTAAGLALFDNRPA